MMEYNDGLGPRRRAPWLILRKADRLILFRGKALPGVLAVLGEDYNKNGVWSSTTYRVELAEGVIALAGSEGWETGRFSEGLTALTGKPTDRWVEMANALGVALPEARRFLTEWRPKAAARLDEVEAQLASLDDASETGAAEAAISFGSPTNRGIRDGFWEWPVRVLGADGAEIGAVVPTPTWDRPVPTGPVKVLDAVHTDGIHGGTWSLRLAVPVGARLEHGQGA